MLLRLLVIFYFAFDATFLGDHSSFSRGSLVGCLSVSQPTQYHEDVYEGLFRRQSSDQQNFGIIMFPQANFLGNGTHITNVSANGQISVGGSFQVLATTWAAITSPSDNNTFIVWYSVRDTSALSLPSGQLVITNIQSSRCSPPCAGPGTCDPFAQEAQCKCPQGFNGTMCQSCANGHFGPKCQPCPSNCTTSCDQGITGSGRCLMATPVRKNAVLCDSNNGQCNCPPGQGNNGTGCAQCQPGFFSNSTGGCEVCGFGCSVCDNQTGNCNTCQTGFTLASDKSKCQVLPSQTSNGAQCPPQSYNNGTGCPPCPFPKLCPQCSGPSSSNCLVCANLLAMFENSCVETDENGICDGSGGMIADNNKKKCESCGAIEPNCASCKIQGFNVGSTINQAKCTGCLDGFFLSSNGTCASTCPSGTFTSNNTCTECSSQCKTCGSTADQCLTCAEDLFVSSGKCVSTCPQGTFSSNGTCINCHPDCGTCKGTSFDECLTCSSNLPVLESGRCLATCNQTTTQFFNTAASACQNCDPSCSSCFGSGPNNCLACTNPSFMVVNGTCSPTPQLVPASQL